MFFILYFKDGTFKIPFPLCSSFLIGRLLNQILQPDKKLNIDKANLDKLFFFKFQLFHYIKYKLPSFLSISK